MFAAPLYTIHIGHEHVEKNDARVTKKPHLPLASRTSALTA